MTNSLSSPDIEKETLVTVGHILKPFGVRGEVKVESLSDVPGRFEGLRDVTLASEHYPPFHTTVTGIRPIPSGYILGFSGISTPEEASLYRGAWIQIPEDANLPRQANTYYYFELIGLRVDDSDGQTLGHITEIVDFPQHQVMIVRNGEREVLIPATLQTVQEVDLDNKCLQLTSNEWWDLTYAL